MIYLTNIDLNKNQLLNAVVHPLSTPPVSPAEGQIYTDLSEGKIKQYINAAWKTIGVVVESSETNGAIKVDGVEMTVYTLPAATEETLGGIKVGSGFTITAEGLLSAIPSNIYNGTKTEGETDTAALTRIVDGATLRKGDIAILKTLIQGDKYSYTAFVYDTEWRAMDGNVNAENVFLADDITLAGSYTQVGNITKGQTATGSLPAAGKSLKDVLQSIFTKELNPSTTQPSVSVTMTPSGAKEVGTKVTPSYNATLNAGSYTYGPATGITASSWSVTSTASETGATATGAFNELTIADNTNYHITATAQYEQGAMPKTNLGNDYPSGRIAAGSKSGNSAALTGFRSFFYGSKTAAVALNSDSIRSLTNSNKAVVPNQEFQVTVVEGAMQVIVAFPTAINKTLKKVLDVGAFGTDIVGSFIKTTVEVEGANGFTAVSYDVYTYSPAAALGANTYKVTIG